jgi:hypothetical protein
MSNEENEQFLTDVRYFWFEKGDVERFTGFSMERFREADPVLATAYEQMKLSIETFNRLLDNEL